MSERKEPYIVQVQPGRRSFCTCNKSEFMPICDGSHAGTGKKPAILEFDTDKTIAICGCGHSGNMPYCDGSHKKL